MATVPFIRYAGNNIVKNPFAIRHAKAFGFAVDGNLDSIQALIDKTLNLSPDTRYRAVSSTVLIAYMRMQELACALPPDDTHGCYCENELNVSFLMAVEERHGVAWVPKRLAWYLPYLWLDSNHAMIAGRDIYGFPKQYGTLTLPLVEGEKAEFTAVSEVLPKYEPSERAAVLPIAIARRTDAPTLQFERPFGELVSAVETFTEEALRLDKPLLFIGASLADLTAEHLVNLAFLRQLPCNDGSTMACYQSVAEASTILKDFRGGSFLKGDYEIEIPYYASTPWAQEIGLAPGPQDVTVKAHAGFYLDIDFDFSFGREIWTTT
jgi:hypothetical protein